MVLFELYDTLSGIKAGLDQQGMEEVGGIGLGLSQYVEFLEGLLGLSFSDLLGLETLIG